MATSNTALHAAIDAGTTRTHPGRVIVARLADIMRTEDGWDTHQKTLSGDDKGELNAG